MAVKKFDVPDDIDNAISEAQAKEDNKENLDTAKYIAERIDLFLKESPNFVQAMNDIMRLIHPERYMNQVNNDMRKTAENMAKVFELEVRPIIDEIKKKNHCICMPVTLFVVSAITMLILFGFFTFMVVLSFKSNLGFIENIIFWSTFIWYVMVAIFIYVAYKLNW